MQKEYFNITRIIIKNKTNVINKTNWINKTRWINKTNEIDTQICKFCYESFGELINVCNCKGTHAYIHKECLHNWQLQTILNQSTHPDYQINSDTICSVCNSEFKIKNKSRHCST